MGTSTTFHLRSMRSRIFVIALMAMCFGAFSGFDGVSKRANGAIIIGNPTDPTDAGVELDFDLGQTLSPPPGPSNLLDSLQFYGYTVGGLGATATLDVQIFLFNQTTGNTIGPAVYSSGPITTAPITNINQIQPIQTFTLSIEDVPLTLFGFSKYYLIDFQPLSGPAKFELKGTYLGYSGGSPWSGGSVWTPLGDGVNFSYLGGFKNFAFQATFVPEPSSICFFTILSARALFRKPRRLQHPIV